MGIGRWILSGTAMLLAAACSPQAATDSQTSDASAPGAEATHPVSGLEVIPVTISTQDGDHRFAAEVAATQEEQARGLMFRTELGPDEAMIFPRQGDVASFWMKNTPLPLDIIFIGRDRKIINIAAQTTPYSLDSVSALAPTSAVLEIHGGRAAELGIGPGDRVEW